MKLKNKLHKTAIAVLIITVLGSLAWCRKPKTEEEDKPIVPIFYPIDVWTTSGDQSNLLKNQSAEFAKGKDERFPVITVDTTQRFQTVDGFGFTLTGGSAYLINKLGPTDRDALLQELFGNKANSIGISYLRVSLGASDLSPSVFSYNDLFTGQTDLTLDKFSLSQDTLDLIPTLKRIIAINPNIKIMASPWSPPTWMKTNNSSIGGTLKSQYFDVYARYFVKYIQQMRANGITIDAVTLQNEPEAGGNNPSMLMTAAQSIDFVKNNLGPAFKAANIATKIIVWDHNCDKPDYPISVLNDAAAKPFIDGSAFHLYAGDISALSKVSSAHPDKNVYFTEQWTSGNGIFSADFKWHLTNVVIGSMRNKSKVALEWNLASDASFSPRTPGGCTLCKGAITIESTTITRNVGYYIIGQVSKFVPSGSVRIASDLVGNFQTVAFQRADGKKVLVVLNDGSSLQSFNINCHDKWITAALAGGTAATYIW